MWTRIRPCVTAHVCRQRSHPNPNYSLLIRDEGEAELFDCRRSFKSTTAINVPSSPLCSGVFICVLFRKQIHKFPAAVYISLFYSGPDGFRPLINRYYFNNFSFSVEINGHKTAEICGFITKNGFVRSGLKLIVPSFQPLLKTGSERKNRFKMEEKFRSQRSRWDDRPGQHRGVKAGFWGRSCGVIPEKAPNDQ